MRYRNLLLLDQSFRRDSHWHAFVDDEVFINLSADNFNQNRFQIGGGLHLYRRCQLDLYYLQKNPGSGRATHVVGTILTIKLNRHVLAPNP